MPTKRKRTYKHSKKAGKAPGTLIYTGEVRDTPPELTLIRYDLQNYHHQTSNSLDETLQAFEAGKVNWINVDALHDTGLVEKIGERFGLHSLVLEDVLNTDQIPKVDDMGDYIAVSLKMLSLTPEKEIDNENVSLILGKDMLISFQERKGDIFEPVRNRIEEGLGRARKKGPDYLLFALMDVVVDNYYFVLEHLADVQADMEQELLGGEDNDIMVRITEEKQKINVVRKAANPLRENIRKIAVGGNKLIQPDIVKYYNDVLDHINQINQELEVLRDQLNGFVDIHHSNINNKMNNVMKTLTVIATIFIPLTFIAGIYGMNFEYMPELGWHYGYPTALGIMFVLGVSMFIYMKRKYWL